MIPVREDLRLHDRDEVGLLAERRVSGERMPVGVDGEGGWKTGALDRDDGRPLGEAGSELHVPREALPQPVESFGHLLTGRSGETLCPGEGTPLFLEGPPRGRVWKVHKAAYSTDAMRRSLPCTNEGYT